MDRQLVHLASAAALRSQFERAARLFGASDALVERTGTSIWPVVQELGARCRATATARLGPDTFEALRQEGCALPLEALLDLLLS